MGKPCSILIVEDHEDIRYLLQQLLEHEGYRAIACSSAVDALSILQAGEPVCLILLDLMMPGVSGFQFREQQRSSPFSAIPVAVVTAASSAAEYHGNLGAVEYLRKPVDLDRVLAIVRQYCDAPEAARTTEP